MWSHSVNCGKQLGEMAVRALIEEAELTPKPGLVDLRSSGSHTNMDIALMRASAESLSACFEAMGRAAYERKPNRELREELGALGRAGEQRMMQATHGVNTHRGAIWALGLLIAGAAVRSCSSSAEEIAAAAGSIARFPDRHAPLLWTNGRAVKSKYGIRGARDEAMKGFPHVIRIGLPVLREMRLREVPEATARLHVLLSIMAELHDTCLLHRGGLKALDAAQQGARRVMDSGGLITASGRQAYLMLEQDLLESRVSPGGSADLLSAVLLLDKIQNAAGIANMPRGGFGDRTINL